MTEAETVTAIIALAGLMFAVLTASLGLLWRVSGQWSRATTELRYLGDQVRELTTSRERDQSALMGEVRRVANRQDRHEEWHAERAPGRRVG